MTMALSRVVPLIYEVDMNSIIPLALNKSYASPLFAISEHMALYGCSYTAVFSCSLPGRKPMSLVGTTDQYDDQNYDTPTVTQAEAQYLLDALNAYHTKREWHLSDIKHAFCGFRPLINDLNQRYHRLTHLLGEAIVESLGEDIEAFREYFDFDDPDLAASLNHNYGLDVYAEEDQDKVRKEYKKFSSDKVGAHIDGPPFIALLINDRPGLQVVAAEGEWIDAPVTCRTAPGDYHVPVISGSVIVNTGGTLMHLSEGRYSATLHRVNTTLIPKGETRVSMPYFLIPKMEGDLIPFGKSKAGSVGVGGYESGRDRGANASVNRMGTFPQVTRRWWVEEYSELRQQQRNEVEAETQAALKLAKERGERFTQDKT